MTTKAKFRFDASAIFLPGIGVLLLLLLWAITSSTLSKNLPSPDRYLFELRSRFRNVDHIKQVFSNL